MEARCSSAGKATKVSPHLYQPRQVKAKSDWTQRLELVSRAPHMRVVSAGIPVSSEFPQCVVCF